MATLNEKIRAIRLAKGMTQEQVGKALGTTKGNYNRIEKGNVGVSATKLEQLAALFKMSPQQVQDYYVPDQEDPQQVEIARLRQELARLQYGEKQEKLVLREVATFIDLLDALLHNVYFTDENRAVTWQEVQRNWLKLVTRPLYPGNSKKAKAPERQHRLASPLRMAKQAELALAVQLLRTVLQEHLSEDEEAV